MNPFDLRSAAHRPRSVHAVDHREVLHTASLLILHLLRCLQDEVNRLRLRFLLLVDLNFVLFQTVLAHPDLTSIIAFGLLNLTVDIETSLALLTENRVPSCQLGLVLKRRELNLEDVSVDLLSDDLWLKHLHSQGLLIFRDAPSALAFLLRHFCGRVLRIERFLLRTEILLLLSFFVSHIVEVDLCYRPRITDLSIPNLFLFGPYQLSVLIKQRLAQVSCFRGLKHNAFTIINYKLNWIVPL